MPTTQRGPLIGVVLPHQIIESLITKDKNQAVNMEDLIRIVTGHFFPRSLKIV